MAIPTGDKDPKILSLINFLGNPITNGPRGPFFVCLSVCLDTFYASSVQLNLVSSMHYLWVS